MDGSVLSVVLWTLFLCTAQPVESFTGGPPGSVCISRYPHHSGANSRVTPSPFTIRLSDSQYTSGDPITVTIEAESGANLRGVILQARRQDVNIEESIGIFQNLLPADKLQYISCHGYANNTVGHKNAAEVPSVEATWVANENYGPVVFYATVLQSYSHFFADVTSDVLQPRDPSVPVVAPSILASTTANNKVNIDWGECGNSKGCLLYPGYCTDTDCIAGVSFKVNSADNTVTFEMMAKVVGYVSLGFSDDKIMGDDQTISCTADFESVYIQNGYNHEEKYNVEILGTNLTKLEAYASDDEYLSCRFTRPMAMDIAGMKTFDLTDDYYLFIAWGPIYSLSTSMNIHIELPVISNSKISFTDASTYRGSVMPDLIRAHSSLMTICWMVFAALAIVMPRYYKQGFNGRKILGKPIWFQLHRAASIVTLVLTIIGLILVLVLLDGKLTEKKSAYNHMCLGFTVVALVIAQVLAGLVRPDPTSALRPYFNFFHRLMGIGAVVIAAACIIYAYKIVEFSYAMREFGEKTMAIWISVFVLLHLVLIGYEFFAPHCAGGHDANAYNMDKDDEEPEQNKPATPSLILFFIFVFFLVCSFIAALLMTVLF